MDREPVLSQLGGLSLHSRCRPAARLLLVVLAMLGLMSAVLPGRAQAAGGKPIRWLLHGPGAAAIMADPVASQLLDNAQPFVMVGRLIRGAPPAWNATLFAAFSSIRAIASALDRGALMPGVRGIMYDNERWRFTPQEEQQNPNLFHRQAAEMVHAHGLMFLTAPAVNLVAATVPEGGNRRYDAFLQMGIAAEAARYADVIDIQAQGSERDTAKYANFVRQAAAQARQANPNVVVLAGISTQPNGQQVTADDILRSIAATRDAVDGYWFNIPQPSPYCPRCTEFRPDIAIEVLRRLAGH
jgi:hypothetical protein